MSQQKRKLIIQLCLNSNRSISKTCQLEPISSGHKFYKKLVQIAKQKLRIKRKKKAKPLQFYLIQTGELITTSNITQLISHKYAEKFQKNLSISISLGEAYCGKILNPSSIPQNSICLIKCIQSHTLLSTDSYKQLESCSRLLGMKLCVGQPDLHCGKGYPIGVSLISSSITYPSLIGTDIGCGMSLIETPIGAKECTVSNKINKWINDINIDGSWCAAANLDNDKMNEILSSKLLDWPQGTVQNGIDMDNIASSGIDIHLFDNSLGTIGSGNHFAEFQLIDRIIDNNLFNELGLNSNKLYLMIHSGSRGFGAAILDNYLMKHSSSKSKSKAKGINTNTNEFKSYFSLHNNALKWAKRNRMIIAKRIIESCGYDFNKSKCLIDIYHNYLKSKHISYFADIQNEIKRREYANINPKYQAILDIAKDCLNLLTNNNMDNKDDNGDDVWWIHRKGAAPSDEGYVVIPGSRGSVSYIVKPLARSSSGYAIAHGAGRKLTRSNAFKKISKRCPNVNVLNKTKIGSYVICENKQLMYEEHPDAYKNISNVIKDLEEYNLIKTVAILKPVITYKTKSNKYAR